MCLKAIAALTSAEVSKSAMTLLHNTIKAVFIPPICAFHFLPDFSLPLNFSLILLDCAMYGCEVSLVHHITFIYKTNFVIDFLFQIFLIF